MAKNDNLKDFLTDVADAIREKKGTEDLINPQDFSDEIKNLPSGSSPFAVDFGEEIASNNSKTISELEEDIAYYNEIQRKRTAGEVQDDKLLNDADFISRIAWIPKGMVVNSKMLSCTNLYELPDGVLSAKGVPSYYNAFTWFARLKSLKGTCPAKGNDFGFNITQGYVGEIDILFDQLTQIRQQSFCNYVGKTLKVRLPEATSISGNTFTSLSGVKIVHVEMPKVTSLTNVLRDNDETEEMYVDVSSLLTSSYSIGYNTKKLKVCYIKGLQTTLSINRHTGIGLDSVKYILDNCQARADGTSYTLTLNAAVKNAFLAKCDEDAEYAASLASANAKGLTLA